MHQPFIRQWGKEYLTANVSDVNLSISTNKILVVFIGDIANEIENISNQASSSIKNNGTITVISDMIFTGQVSDVIYYFVISK